LSGEGKVVVVDKKHPDQVKDEGYGADSYEIDASAAGEAPTRRGRGADTVVARRIGMFSAPEGGRGRHLDVRFTVDQDGRLPDTVLDRGGSRRELLAGVDLGPSVIERVEELSLDP
jgi:hypothetical protein